MLLVSRLMTSVGRCDRVPNGLCDVTLQALEKAKEAGRKERALVRQRQQSGYADQINLDLTYSVSQDYMAKSSSIIFGKPSLFFLVT